MLSSHPSAPSTLFLDRVLRDLDTQLDRLQSARNTIAGLSISAISDEPLFANAPELLLELAAEPAVEVELAPQGEAQQPRRRGRPRGSRNRFPSVRRAHQQPPPEPRALASTIPTGPVVVSAAELARKREDAAHLQAAHTAAPVPPAEGTLEALIREVERRSAA